jgi:hypothetical protein
MGVNSQKIHYPHKYRLSLKGRQQTKGFENIKVYRVLYGYATQAIKNQIGVLYIVNLKIRIALSIFANFIDSWVKVAQIQLWEFL